MKSSKAPKGAFILPKKGERKTKMSSKNIFSIVLSSLIFLGVAVLSDAQECSEDIQINETETTEITIEESDEYIPEKMDLEHNIISIDIDDEPEAIDEENSMFDDLFIESEVVEENIVIETAPSDEVVIEPIPEELIEITPEVESENSEVITEVPANKYDYESAPYFENRCTQYLMTDYDIRVLPDPDADILVSLPAGSSVEVIAMSGFSPWLQVEVEGKTGYVNIMVLNTEKDALNSSDLSILNDTETEDLWQELI